MPLIDKSKLDFIRFSISNDTVVPVSTKSIDWYDFLHFCNRQGVIGLVFEGMQKADLRIDPKNLFLWISYSEHIKRQNRIINQRIEEIQQFFIDKDRRSCILKGQANGLMYPKPEVRSPGDIDIWVEGNPIDIIMIVRKFAPQAPYSYNHIKMPIFNDVSVEVHYRPVNMMIKRHDKRLQEYVKEIKNNQFSHKEKIGTVEIGSLTNEFNALYQILHMYSHFFTTRNSFKQFIDYYYLLKKGLPNEAKKNCMKMFKRLKIENYSSGIMWIMKDVLGLDDSFIIGNVNEREGLLILKESFYYGTGSKNKYLSVLEQTIANVRLINHYPAQILFRPIYLAWHQWWKLKMKVALKKTNPCGTDYAF